LWQSYGARRCGLFDRLTPRQLEILELLAQGSANTDHRTVSLVAKMVGKKVSTIFDQLGVRSWGQARVLAREAEFGRS
jgi:DNA-binding NarL/FixJ family response regulator